MSKAAEQTAICSSSGCRMRTRVPWVGAAKLLSAISMRLLLDVSPVTSTVQPGLIALHGNRAETLTDTVFAWLQQRPLTPLEDEVILVQSNGMAEWFKMAQARSGGVCAATRVELPA